MTREDNEILLSVTRDRVKIVSDVRASRGAATCWYSTDTWVMTLRPPLSSSPPQSSFCSPYQSTTLSDPITRETFTEIRRGWRIAMTNGVSHGSRTCRSREPCSRSISRLLLCAKATGDQDIIIYTLRSFKRLIFLWGRGAPYLAAVVIAKPQHAPIGLCRMPIRSANVSEDHADPDSTRSRTKLAIVRRWEDLRNSPRHSTALTTCRHVECQHSAFAYIQRERPRVSCARARTRAAESWDPDQIDRNVAMEAG